MLANAGTDRNMLHDRVHRTLTVELERPTQLAFGIIKRLKVPCTGTTGPVKYRYHPISLRQVRLMLQRVEDVLDPLAGGIPADQIPRARTPVGTLPGIAQAIKTLNGQGPYSTGDTDEVMLARWAVMAENATRERHAQRVNDLILDATIPNLAEFATGSYAIDETSVEAWALPSRQKKDDPDRVPSADPDAQWGHRTPTNADEREMIFGYNATAMVRVRDLGKSGPFPVLCERLVLRPLSAGGANAAMVAIDSLQTKDSATVKEVLADILYSQGTPENWVHPLRERQITPTFDLHPNDRGPRYDQSLGVLWIDGWPHCPNTPTELLDLTRPKTLCRTQPIPTDQPTTEQPEPKDPKHKPRIYPPPPPTKRRRDSQARREAAAARRAIQAELDRAAMTTFEAGIKERSKYAFRRLAGPSPDGTERFQCPARAGYIACAGCPLSMLIPTDDKIDNPPNPSDPTRAKCCAQETITAPGDVLAKTRQRLRYGTPKWIESFSRRARIEGVFGQLKEPGSNQIRRGWTRSMGLIKTSMMLLMVVAANNIEAARRHARATGNGLDHHLLLAEPPFLGFVEITDPEQFQRIHETTGTEPDPPD